MTGKVKWISAFTAIAHFVDFSHQIEYTKSSFDPCDHSRTVCTHIPMVGVTSVTQSAPLTRCIGGRILGCGLRLLGALDVFSVLGFKALGELSKSSCREIGSMGLLASRARRPLCVF